MMWRLCVCGPRCCLHDSWILAGLYVCIFSVLCWNEQCRFVHIHSFFADPPVYSLLPNRPTTVLEGVDFTYSFGFEAKPTPTNFTWSRDGQVISSGGRIATSVSTVNITSTTRSDSVVYEVVSYNEAGRGAGNFILDVQCE